MVSCAAYLEITKISIHAPARGATSLFKVGKTSNALFQSTPPARGGDPQRSGIRRRALKISIHAPREGGRLHVGHGLVEHHLISIHAPREGGDISDTRHNHKHQRISIHAPREGGDDGTPYIIHATIISIHAPREGGDEECTNSRHANLKISIHAPREGGDMTRCADMPTACRFQSTPPARGATGYRSSVLHRPFYFNPRPPRGGRHGAICRRQTTVLFQSTPPARGATLYVWHKHCQK